MSTTRRLAVALSLVSLLLFIPPVGAQEPENTVRFGVGWYATIGDANDISDNGLGIWGSYERRFYEAVAVDFMAAYVDYDSIFDLLGDISLTSLTATLNFYVYSFEEAEFYVGPTLGFARLELDGERGLFGLRAERKSDSGLAWGAAAGVDVPVGESGWVLSGSLRFLSVSFDEGGFHDLDFDNIVIHAGAGYRF
jgi:hypothetical protein